MTRPSFPDPHASAADPDARIDLSVPRRVHVVGVGGAGMRAIAEVLAAMGHTVSGSDLKDAAGFARLRAAGVTVTVGHDPAIVTPEHDVVAVSTAIPERNVELQAARRLGIPVCSRASVLAAIAATRDAVAVAGTHGKTTTSSMLALVLVEAGLHPGFIIGGDLNEIGTGSAWDEGRWFVVEADESDGTFLELPRAAAIVTSVEPDHLEHWGSFAGLRAAFARFAAETPGPVVMCADDAAASEIAREVGAVTYGTTGGADYRMTDVVSNRAGTTFALGRRGEPLGEVHLPVAGLYNARNAAAAIAASIELGVAFEAGRAAMARFAGVARRYQYRGEVAGVTFVDDYAHLPTEVASALAAARDGGFGRIVCVFQPHRFSRTSELWPSFADAFVDADVVVVTDVYASGELPRPGVSGKLVVQAVLDAHPWRRVAYLPHRDDLATFLLDELRPGDLCLTLGAGDLTTLPDEVVARLTTRAAGAA